MKKTQNGFAHLALVLLLIVVAVVGWAGYTVYKNHQASTSANQTSTAITSTPAQAINSKADLNKAVDSLNSQNVDSSLNPDSLNNDVSTLL